MTMIVGKGGGRRSSLQHVAANTQILCLPCRKHTMCFLSVNMSFAYVVLCTSSRPHDVLVCLCQCHVCVRLFVAQDSKVLLYTINVCVMLQGALATHCFSLFTMLVSFLGGYLSMWW